MSDNWLNLQVYFEKCEDITNGFKKCKNILTKPQNSLVYENNPFGVFDVCQQNLAVPVALIELFN